MSDYYKEKAPLLVENGFDVTPTNGKRPTLHAWNTRPATAKNFKNFSKANTGVLCLTAAREPFSIQRLRHRRVWSRPPSYDRRRDCSIKNWNVPGRRHLSVSHRHIFRYRRRQGRYDIS